MKKVLRINLFIIAFILLMFYFSCTAYASNINCGIEATIVSDKDIYNSNEEIDFKLVIKNTNNFTVNNVSMEEYLPEELKIINDNHEKVKVINSIEAGETCEILFKAISQNSDNSIKNNISKIDNNKILNSKEDNLSTTKKENFNVILIISIALVVLILIIVIIIFLKKHKNITKITSLLLCVDILVTGVGLAIFPADAKEEKGQTYKTDVNKYNINTSKTVFLDDKMCPITVNIEFEVRLENQQIEDVDYSDLITLNNGEMPFISYNNNGSINFIKGTYTSYNVENELSAIVSLNALKTLLKIRNPVDEFKCIDTYKNDINTQYRLQQYYQGVIVDGKTVVVTVDLTGKVTAFSGDYESGLDINTEPKFTIKDVYRNFFSKTKKEDFFEDKDIELKIVNLDGNKLTWNFYKEDEDKDEGYKYIVSAETGEVLKKYNDPIISLNIKSSGKNLNNQDVEFNTLKSKNNKYFMIDIERNIFLYDIAKEKRKINFNNEKIFNRTLNTFVNSKLFTNNDGIWNDKTANSLISNISYVYDYYENNLNRKSPNGNDSQIYVYAHWSKKNSAISLTSNDKKYTWLLFSEEAPAAKALDVVAHEYTHSVIANTANLIYKNETGALNEAYADILGNLIENHDDPNWRLGEDMFDGKKEFRNMSNPQFNKQPEHYNNFIKTRDDDGGVHINSGIVNKAFYLMWKNGLTNKRMLAKLWYRSLNYLWANSLFVDCRNAIIASANDMCLNQNQIAIIKEAFDNVGIHSNQYTSTANLQNGGILTGQGDTIYYAVNGTAYSHIFSKKEGEEPKHLLEDNENQGAIKDLNIVGDCLYYKQGTTLDDNCLWGNYKIYEFNLKTNERKIIEEDGDYPIATSSGLYYLRKSGNYPKSERFLDSSGKVLSEKNYQMVRSEYELSDLIFYSFSDKNKKVIKSGIYTLALDNDRIVYGILEKYVMAAMGVPTVTYYFLSDNSKSPTNARLAYMESFTVGQFTYSYGNKGYKRSDKNGNSSMEIGNFREGWFNNAYYPINNYVYYNQDIFFACFDDNNIYRCDYSKGTKDLVYSTEEVECGKHMAIYNGKLYTIIKGQLIEITKI